MLVKNETIWNEGKVVHVGDTGIYTGYNSGMTEEKIAEGKVIRIVETNDQGIITIEQADGKVVGLHM